MNDDPIKSIISLVREVRKTNSLPDMIILHPKCYRWLKIQWIVTPYQPLGRLA